MPSDARSVAERAVRDLLRALAGVSGPTALRVADKDGRLACLLVVWDADRVMPVGDSHRGGARSAPKETVAQPHERPSGRAGVGCSRWTTTL